MPKFDDPDTQNPVASFLSNYFATKNAFQDSKLGLTKLGLEQQKFQAEQANHAADMKQRADQFTQEMNLRQSEQTNTQAYQKAMLDAQAQQRIDASQERFRQAGGELINTPDPNKTQTDTIKGSILPPVPGITAPPMAPAATQPVGPTQPDTLAQLATGASAQLPQGMLPPPSVTSTVQVPVGQQMREQGLPPEGYFPTASPLGTPKGQTAFFPTKEEVSRQTAAGKAEEAHAGWGKVTPAQFQANPKLWTSLGLGIGDALDPKIQEAMMTHLLTSKSGLEDKFKMGIAAKARELNKDPGDLSSQEINQVLKEQSDAGERTDQAFASTLLAQQRENNLSTQKKIGAQIGETLIDNPDATVPKDKESWSAANDYMRTNYGISAPQPMQPDDKRQFNAAERTMSNLSILKDYLKDPDVANQFGALAGREQEYQQMLGSDVVNRDPGMKAKMQMVRTLLTGNMANELGIMSPRGQVSLLGLVKEMSPNVRMEPSMFEGALDGVSQIAYNRMKTVRETQFGGKIPPEIESRVMKGQGTINPPIAKENPAWRQAGNTDYIGPNQSKIVTRADKSKVYVFHDRSNDKFYELMSQPKQ